jgi:NAD(P)-dependent dehydrogenase (short-subunit alcohol dehydrogenase family)
MKNSSSTVFITGASRGLGFEFVRQYAADKWNVIACCREPSSAEKLQALAKTNPAVRIEKLDVTDDENIAALADKFKDTAIDLLISNAGIFSGAGPHINAMSGDKTQDFGSLDSQAWMKVLRTNTIAPMMVAQAFQHNLSLRQGSKLVMISSRMGSIGSLSRETGIAYRTSKAALNAAMKSASIDLKDQGTIVISFHPGWVQTDMGGKEANLTPEESVASMRRTIANLKPENSGQFLTYDGQILPW